MQRSFTMNDLQGGTLRILCLGDSLTAGYTCYGLNHFPYSTYIQASLKAFLPSTEILVKTSGLSGDCVVGGQYLGRMVGNCKKAADIPFDWIIVMGGTNDLGMGREPAIVYEGLSKCKEIYDVVFESSDITSNDEAYFCTIAGCLSEFSIVLLP